MCTRYKNVASAKTGVEASDVAGVLKTAAMAMVVVAVETKCPRHASAWCRAVTARACLTDQLDS